MKFCPMCGTTQSKVGARICELCDYEEKPIDELTDAEIEELMAPYIYERTYGGVRINSVKSGRNIGLRGKVALPHFVTEIAAGAFANCKFITRLDLPIGLRFIGENAFANCRDLFDVFIPDSVSFIGKGAFADCLDLSVICAAADAQLDTWDSEWLCDCPACVEWASI